MEDPQNSAQLSDGGARLNNGGKGKRARRRSRKGRRKAAAGVPASHDAVVADGSEQVRSPESGEAKHGRNGKAARHPSSDQKTGETLANSPDHDGDKPARRKRKRRRGRRAHTKGPLGADGCKHIAGNKPAASAEPFTIGMSSPGNS